MTRHRKPPERPRSRWGATVSFGDVVIACLAVSSALAALSSTAWALCPNCLGQARVFTPTMELLGVFLLVPFVVFLIALRAIRRAGRF